MQMLRQTQALREALAASDGQVTALKADMQQLQAELQQCKRKAVADQEQVCG